VLSSVDTRVTIRLLGFKTLFLWRIEGCGVFRIQSKPALIAWLLIPLGFGVFVSGAYGVALVLVTLPFALALRKRDLSLLRRSQ
jgi:hypothetical protein